jgi:ABC-2 type transport system ATP-binding protein
LVKAVDAMLRRASLDDRAGQLCRTLSGGYQRRVNICASLLQNPVALVLDEPTVGIDVDAREALHELLDGLRDQGAALLLATHDLEQAQLMCDRIGVMHEGRICVEGEPAALLRRAFGTDKEVVVAFRASPSDLGRSVLRDMDFKPTQSPLTWFGRCAADRLDAGALGQRFAGAGLVVKEIRIREPDLASLFRDTLGRDAPP